MGWDDNRDTHKRDKKGYLSVADEEAFRVKRDKESVPMKYVSGEILLHPYVLKNSFSPENQQNKAKGLLLRRRFIGISGKLAIKTGK